MFKGFVLGVMATILIAVACGYAVLRIGMIQPMPMPSPVGLRPGQPTRRSTQPSLATRPPAPIPSP